MKAVKEQVHELLELVRELEALRASNRDQERKRVRLLARLDQLEAELR